MYSFSFKIIISILNKATQYISFLAIGLFLTFFLLIKEGLVVYEDIFINSLKGLYPEFLTQHSSIANKYKDNENITISKEVFVHSEEVMFSYDGDEGISKFMNVRTFNSQYKEKLFNTLNVSPSCRVQKNTVWISNRLYDNMIQDKSFNQKSIFFVNEEDEYIQYPVCVFALGNNEKWLITSTNTAKEMVYMPETNYIFYASGKKTKESLYSQAKVNNWKKYIDYEDLGIFLLSKEISSTFLISFFLFLVVFMIIAFSSLAKEFQSSIFLQKLFGMNIYQTIFFFSLFFFLYILILFIFVWVEYHIIYYILYKIIGVELILNYSLFFLSMFSLFLLGLLVSIAVTKKYHRLPL
jgi:hypothetical protein